MLEEQGIKWSLKESKIGKFNKFTPCWISFFAKLFFFVFFHTFMNFLWTSLLKKKYILNLVASSLQLTKCWCGFQTLSQGTKEPEYIVSFSTFIVTSRLADMVFTQGRLHLYQYIVILEKCYIKVHWTVLKSVTSRFPPLK